MNELDLCNRKAVSLNKITIWNQIEIPIGTILLRRWIVQIVILDCFSPQWNEKSKVLDRKIRILIGRKECNHNMFLYFLKRRFSIKSHLKHKDYGLQMRIAKSINKSLMPSWDFFKLAYKIFVMQIKVPVVPCLKTSRKNGSQIVCRMVWT